MRKYISNNKPLAVLGNTHTGKTNLCIYLARNSGYESMYLLGYPSKIDGFQNLNDIRDLNKIRNAVVVIDELDEIVPLTNRRAEGQLKSVLKFTAHRNIKLIFNTQLSQFISKTMSAMVSQWAITEIDIFELKNGSKPKRILLDYIRIPEIVNKHTGMALEVGKFVWYNDKSVPTENGIYRFPFQDVGKDW